MQQQNIQEFDVLVLGASLAGASSALRLASYGLQVGIVDQAQFPRTKACGEGFSKLGFAALEELLGATQAAQLLHRAGAVALSGYQLSHQGHVRRLTLSSEPALSTALTPVWGLQRSNFDSLLLQAAQALPTTCAYLGEKVETISCTDSAVELQTRSGLRLRAQALILASGAARGPLEQVCGAQHESPSRRSAATVRWSGAAHGLAPYVQLRLERDAQWFITPTSATSFNISRLAKPPVLSAQQFLQAARRIVEEFGLDAAGLGEVYGAADVRARVQPKPHSARVFAVGDSAERLDPLGGMGMTHALLSAQAAACALRKALAHEISFEHAARSYAETREALAAPLRQYTGLLYTALLRAPQVLRLPEGLLTFAARTADKVHLARSERRRQALCRANLYASRQMPEVVINGGSPL